MIFTADRKTIWEAANTVSRIAGGSEAFPELGGIMIEVDESGSIRLTGCDIITFVQRRIQALHLQSGGSTVVSALLFTEITKLLPEDTVYFELNRNALTIKSGSAIYSIRTMNADKFPQISIPFPADTIRIVGLSSLIKNTVYATSEQENELLKQSVKITFSGGATTASATDGRRMALTQSQQCADGDLEMIIHKKALNVLYSIIGSKDELYVGIAGKCVTLFNSSIIFSTRLTEGKFADIPHVINSIDKMYHARLDAKELFHSLDCATTCLQKEDDQCVNMVIDSKSVRFSAQASCGSSNSHATADETIPTSTDGFNYNPGYLLEYLERASGPIELTVDARGFLLLDANQRKYVVSPRGPVKIRVKEQPKEEKAKKPAKKKAPKEKKPAQKAA